MNGDAVRTNVVRICKHLIREHAFAIYIFLVLVWFDAKRPGKQLFSQVGTEPPLPGYYQYFLGVNMSCSRTQHGDPIWARTPDLWIRNSRCLPPGHRAPSLNNTFLLIQLCIPLIALFCIMSICNFIHFQFWF